MFGALGRLVEIHRHQARGLDARLREQFDTPRRAGGQDQLMCQCHRNRAIDFEFAVSRAALT